jgi:hypothetical protein
MSYRTIWVRSTKFPVIMSSDNAVHDFVEFNG